MSCSSAAARSASVSLPGQLQILGDSSMAYTCTRWRWSWVVWSLASMASASASMVRRCSADICLGVLLFVFQAVQVETVGAVDEIDHRSGQQHRLPAQIVVGEARHLRHGRAAQVVREGPEVAFPPDPEYSRFLRQRDQRGDMGPVFSRNRASVAAARRTAGSKSLEASHGAADKPAGGRGGHGHGTDVEHDLRRAGTPGLIPVALDQRHDGAQHHRFRSASAPRRRTARRGRSGSRVPLTPGTLMRIPEERIAISQEAAVLEQIRRLPIRQRRCQDRNTEHRCATGCSRSAFGGRAGYGACDSGEPAWFARPACHAYAPRF